MVYKFFFALGLLLLLCRPAHAAQPNPIVGFDPGCNGASTAARDVGATIQTALNALATSSGGRGTLTVVDRGGCYSSAQITVPKGITLHCADNLGVIQPYEVAAGLFLNRPCALGAAGGVKTLLTGGLSGWEIWNPSLVAPTTARTALTMLAAFAGTGVTLPADGTPAVGGQDAFIQNVWVYGFTQCFDGETIRPWMQNFGGDCTNGLKLNAVHDVGHITQGHFIPYLTVNQTWAETVNTVTAVSSNGGLVQLTVSGIVDIQAGDLVNVDQVGGRPDLNNRWTVSSVSNPGGNTAVTLTGSAFGAFTFTGNITVDSLGNSWYIQSASSMANLASGLTITDSAAALPGATTISWFNRNNSVLFLSAKSTSSQSGDTFTVTPGTFTSGGHLILNTDWRHGKAVDIEGASGSQQTFMSGIFSYYFDTCWYFGLNTEWMNLVNIGCDTNQPFDPTTIAFDFESNTSWNTLVNTTTQSYGTVVKINSTYTPDAAVIMRGSHYMEGVYLAVEEDQGRTLMDGEIVNAGGIFVGSLSGANLEYIGRYPNATIQFGAPTAWPNFAYHPTFLSQQIGIGPGIINPAFPLEIGNNGSDTNIAVQIDASAPLTGFSDNNLHFSPTAMTFSRHGASTAGFNFVTTSGSWGAGANAGSFIFKPDSTETFRLPKSGGAVVDAPAAVTVTGEVALGKISASGSAPGAGVLKFEAVAGTTGGTCKIIAYAGTSTTPTTVIDNVGSGC